MKERDYYIDFLRSFGLLLLVVAHTWSPNWLKTVRTFDVPLMVFISAICYNSLRGGYLAYFKKRFKRIYTPVAVFLVLFFSALFLYNILLSKPQISYEKIIGSFMLLNWPSIGYVWIMRVFLMMAIILPFLDKFFKRRGFLSIILMVGILIVTQSFLVLGVNLIDNKIIRFILDETVLYAIGYSTIAIIGLKIRTLTKKEILAVFLISALATLIFTILNDCEFDPQKYKYPPQSLYLLYGISISTLLWLLRPLDTNLLHFKLLNYISENSMWIYLWHIVPVYLIKPLSTVPNMWFGRFCIVLVSALLLNLGYQSIILKLPSKVYKILQ